MNTVKVKQVHDHRTMNYFFHIVDSIYGNCPQYVPDLESDVRKLFNSRKNPGLEFSDIQAFVAYQNEQPVGRVVGIVNGKANQKWKVRYVRFSMIEFIDDMTVSSALLKAVEEWGKTKGMDALQGPLGITDFDKEGMLVEDFDMVGSMNTIYNPDYYPRHMEAYGLVKEVDWLQVRIDIPQDIPARYARVAQYAREQIGLRVVKLTVKEVFQLGYGKKVFALLNECYQPIFGFSTLSEKQMNTFINKYLRLIDLNLIPVILNDRQEVVGVAITMGSLSMAMQKAGGRLLPMGWYHLLKALKWKREDHVEMLLIAVRPDYQGLGVNAMFFNDLIPIYNNYGFKWAETGPQLEDNVRELSQWKPLHPQFVKRRRCYKKNI